MIEAQILEKKVTALSALIFIIGMALTFFLGWFDVWSGAMASALVAVTIRQFLIGKVLDIFASIIIFGTLFISSYPGKTYSPLFICIILLVGAAYIFSRKCFSVYSCRHYHPSSEETETHGYDKKKDRSYNEPEN